MVEEWSDLPPRPSRATCGHCYASFPKEEMHRWEGAAICGPCFERVRERTGRGPREEVEGSEGKAPTLRDIPKAAPSFPRQDQEEDLRKRLIQLEHEKRRRPDDVALLREIADLYENLGDRDEADRIRDEALRIEPVGASRTARPATEKMKRKATEVRRPPAPRVAPVAPFWEEIPAIFRYPIQGRGIALIGGGGIFFGIALTIAHYSIFGFLITIAVGGYLWSYWFRVINSTVTKGTEPPEWPEFFDAWESFIRPLLAAMACGLIPFAPFLFLSLFGFNVITGPLIIVTFLLGLFTVPMTFLVCALFNSVSAALDYRLVYTSIFKILPDYILCFAGICALLSMSWVADLILSGLLTLIGLIIPMPVIGTALVLIGTSTASLYFGVAISHLVGRLYAQSSGRLDWFGEATEPEKTLSLPVVLAGAGGALLACVVGLLAVMVLPLLLAGAMGLGDRPFQDGTYLRYNILDSDSGWTSMRYDIEKAAGGYRFRANLIIAGTEAQYAEFIVDRGGKFVAGPPEREGPLREFLAPGAERKETRLCGPRGGQVGQPYINDDPVISKRTWKGWDALAVEETDTAGKLYYDRSTGYLVGMDLSGAGRDYWAVLSDTNIDGLDVPAEARRPR